MIPVEKTLVTVVLEIRDQLEAVYCFLAEVAGRDFVGALDGKESRVGERVTVSRDVNDLDGCRLLGALGGIDVRLFSRCRVLTGRCHL